MNHDQNKSRIEELEQEIASLPAGSVSVKKISGKEYYYYRWTENKKRREKYVPAEDVEILRGQIQHRKELEAERKKLHREELPEKIYSERLPQKKVSTAQNHEFCTNVRIGESLRGFSSSVLRYKKRECFSRFHDFIYGEVYDKVLILYGLRRTGKTTMIRQILADMDDEQLTRAAFIQIASSHSLAEVNRDLKYLEEHGYRYIFLDEVTLMEDFIEGAALFSDVFAACGMKIVMSGADSLGFLFAEDEQLYDRCILIHTTFIPYREFESVLGIRGIDEYIRYGGTMSLGGVHYNETATFASKESTDAYVDTAIARNIQHSLRCYHYEGHFRHLQELYDRNELTSAINRVVEDINHRFTLEVLTRDFRSHDLAVSARNLRRDRMDPNDILDRIDLVSVTERLRMVLEIRNKQEQQVVLSEAHTKEIEEYLQLLDLIQQVDVVALPDVNKRNVRTIISQPGMRYAQADALVKSLLMDQEFTSLSLVERNTVLERILSEIKGRMQEDIVLLETKLANRKKEVFVLQFPVGEFDMVVFDPAAGSCEIFEIKHSVEVVPQQYRHLMDEQKCAETEHRFGAITGKYVLYRGEDLELENGVIYRNVESYLNMLSL